MIKVVVCRVNDKGEEEQRTVILRAGKFCHAILGFEAGQVTINGASKVQAIDWLIPVSNHTGMGKRPSN